MTEREKRPGIERVGGYLHRVVPIAEHPTGNVISHALKPLMVEY